jgi:nuclear pore complex protein Nup205
LTLLKSNTFSETHPYLAEQCFELIYKLCLDKNITGICISYLLKHNFFNDHIFRTTKIKNNDYLCYYYNQRAYFMKTIAIQICLGTTTKNKFQISKASIKEIVSLLFNQRNNSLDNEKLISNLEQERTQILEFLDSIDFSIIKEIPKNITTNLIKLEEYMIVEKNLKLYQIDEMKKSLLKYYYEYEKNNFNKTIELKNIKSEIIKILEYSYESNQILKKYNSINNVFEGWKQILEIILLRCFEMLDNENNESILYEILNLLLSKFSKNTYHLLENSMSEAILKVITKLRELRIKNKTSLLPIDNCLNLLNQIIKIILKENTSQITRGNLYSSLSNYLQYTKNISSKVMN